MERVQIGLLFQIFRTSQIAGKLVDAALEGTGVGGADYAVYSYILHGPMTLTELAEGTGMPLTTAAGYVKRFEDRGHVVRTPNPADGRSFLIELSPDAHVWLQGVIKKFTDTIEFLDAVFDEEGIDSTELVAQLDLVQRLIERSVDNLETNPGL